MQVYNDYQKTHIIAVDAVASCVSHHRKINKPIKTVYLCPAYYNQFEKWVSKQMDEESFVKAREIGFQFDGVDIKIGSPLSPYQVYWDFYAQQVQA